MTMDELINKYRSRIINAKDKNEETRKIIYEISHLFCNENPITEEQQIEILSRLRSEIITESVLLHSQDNNGHLELIDATIKMLKGA